MPSHMPRRCSECRRPSWSRLMHPRSRSRRPAFAGREHRRSASQGLAERMAVVDGTRRPHGYTEIPPFDHREVIAGQGTVGLEIAADCPDVDLVVCPVGGGGLISGVAAAITAAMPERPGRRASSPNSPPMPGTRCVRATGSPGAPSRPSARSRTRCAWTRSANCRCCTCRLRCTTSSRSPTTRSARPCGCSPPVPGWSPSRAARWPSPPACSGPASCLPRSRRVAILSGGNVDPVLLAERPCAAGDGAAAAGGVGQRAEASG